MLEVSFFDLATRLFDKVRLIREYVTNLPELQQKMVDKYGTDEHLITADWEKEPYLKFWMMSDGTLIPVAKIHWQTAKDADVDFPYMMKSGALRGHIDEGSKFLAVECMIPPNSEQVEKLKMLFVKYGIAQVSFDHWGRKSFSGYVKSPEHLEYAIEYGELDEKKLKEDGAGPSAGPVNGPAGGGATTENDIAALPTEIGRKRKKRKRTPVIGMKEAVDEDLGRLRKELKQQMVKLMNREEFQVTADLARNFQAVFGVGSPRTYKVAIPIERQQRAAQKLYGDLLREHGNDKGSIEMLIAAMRENRPLGQFAGLTKYDYLYGTRIEVKFQGVQLFLEAKVDFIYDPTQTLYVGDEELVDKIEEDFGHSIKRRKNVIYPVGGKFHPDFFDQLKEMIESQDDRNDDAK